MALDAARPGPNLTRAEAAEGHTKRGPQIMSLTENTRELSG